MEKNSEKLQIAHAKVHVALSGQTIIQMMYICYMGWYHNNV